MGRSGAASLAERWLGEGFGEALLGVGGVGRASQESEIVENGRLGGSGLKQEFMSA